MTRQENKEKNLARKSELTRKFLNLLFNTVFRKRLDVEFDAFSSCDFILES